MCGLIILTTIIVTLCDNAQSFSSPLVDEGILQNTDLYTIIPSAVLMITLKHLWTNSLKQECKKSLKSRGRGKGFNRIDLHGKN